MPWLFCTVTDVIAVGAYPPIADMVLMSDWILALPVLSEPVMLNTGRFAIVGWLVVGYRLWVVGYRLWVFGYGFWLWVGYPKIRTVGIVARKITVEASF